MSTTPLDLLNEHRAYLDYRQEFVRCSCGDTSPHREHLAALLAAREREAAERGAREVRDDLVAKFDLLAESTNYIDNGYSRGLNAAYRAASMWASGGPARTAGGEPE